MKLFYVALRNIAKKWTMPGHDWKAALNLSRFFTKTGCRPTDRRKEALETVEK
jgi:transposase-like protein